MNYIFKDMQARIGCQYISDLPFKRSAVWFELKHLNLADYPMKQLEDFSHYVFGVPYTVIAEVLKRKDVITYAGNKGAGGNEKNNWRKNNIVLVRPADRCCRV